MPELCCKHGVSQATFYGWRAKYAGMGVPLMKRFKELEEENRRVKKMHADVCMGKEVLQEIIEKTVTPARRRKLAPTR